jgi:threonine/homoserine/homoserine lactone efflux protein
MLKVLLQSLILASTGLLSVGSITIVILLLISKRGWRNGLGYALGYTTAYTIIGILIVLLGYRATEKGISGSSMFFPVLLLVFGILLLWVALKNWRKPVSAEEEEPRFFTLMDKITPLKAFGFGAMVSIINFKNLALFLSALSVVVLSDLALPEKITITLLDALVFSLSVIIPVLIYLLFPKGATDLLNAIKDSINKYRRPIGIGIPLFFGFIFLIKGIMELL